MTKTALVTASYAPDFERCRLLCETIDRFVAGYTKHYILVEHRDVALFKQLESSRRVVIDENDLLPRWIRPFPDPSNFGHRRIWLSPRTMPLRGWHVQQFRRIAIAAHTDEDAFFYIDSDVAFLKPSIAPRSGVAAICGCSAAMATFCVLYQETSVSGLNTQARYLGSSR